VDVLDRLRKLQNETGWSDYRIAQKSGLSSGTVSNLFRRNTIPNIYTLESICKGFGITLSQFFADNDLVELTPELKELADNWNKLSDENKQLVLQLIKNLK
jgi:transcriptional regulator with XRE-family HTH domain